MSDLIRVPAEVSLNFGPFPLGLLHEMHYGTTATNMATKTGEEIVSDGDPNQVVPPNDAKQEVSEGKEQNPYGDFASAEPPELIQPGPPETRMKRVDPRHQWINTDKAIPYLCKLCDYTADCSEVGETCS